MFLLEKYLVVVNNMTETPSILMTLIASLMITSALISFFVMAVYGYTPLGFNTLDLGLDSYGSSSDFTSNCSLSSYQYSGSWSCGSNGLSLTGAGSIYYPVPTTTQKTIQGGNYKVKYNLHPTVGDNYYIIVSDSNGGAYIHIIVKGDGLHIPSLFNTGFGHIVIGDAAYIPLAGANTLSDVSIETNYNPVRGDLIIIFNGQTYTVNQGYLPFVPLDSIKTFQGIGSEHGIIIKSMSNNFNPTTSPSSVLDGLSMIIGFLYNVIALLVWNIDSAIFPWELNLLFIKTQAIGIFICVIVIIRG